jgi:acetyl-CoA acetyltransferase
VLASEIKLKISNCTRYLSKIPNGYDRIAQYQMKRYGVTREQLAMCSVIMSIMASYHPDALTRNPRTLNQVLQSKPVGDVTNVLECARRADGGAAILVASSRLIRKYPHLNQDSVVIIGGGEASGPLFPPNDIESINENMFSCEEAVKVALEESQVGIRDIDFFGLYDCFPICLIRAIEGIV